MNDLSPAQRVQQFQKKFAELRDYLAEVVVAPPEVLEASLIPLVAGGHLLVEGGPGVGKTLLAKALADCVDGEFRRVQFTPDLMPADVIGTYIVMEAQGRRRFEFQQGPIFANVLLADEINRATPKAQAALLEGLEEGAVTVANQTYELPQPFFAVATQSPGGADGTFPLPENQLDRFFFSVTLATPPLEPLETILARMTEPGDEHAPPALKAKELLEMTALVREGVIAPELRRLAAALVRGTHPDDAAAPESIKRFVARGASPRAGGALILAAKARALAQGRPQAAREDLLHFAPFALRHRLALNFDGHAEGISPEKLAAEAAAAVAR